MQPLGDVATRSRLDDPPLSSEKLAGVCEWLDFDDPDYDPLHAFEYDGE